MLWFDCFCHFQNSCQNLILNAKELGNFTFERWWGARVKGWRSISFHPFCGRTRCSSPENAAKSHPLGAESSPTRQVNLPAPWSLTSQPLGLWQINFCIFKSSTNGLRHRLSSLGPGAVLCLQALVEKYDVSILNYLSSKETKLRKMKWLTWGHTANVKFQIHLTANPTR
jgi:hypothetical protein